jgi:hypothetical protein
MALVMKAPIWYLPAKASALSGGDGWHRSYLMDVAFKNADKWWVAGMSIHDTAGWFPYDLESTGGADITNQFLAFALTGGMISMILFIALLVLAFRQLGRAIRAVSESHTPSSKEHLLWGLAVMLGAHVFNWFGITYFDQTYLIWFLQLAAITNLSQSVLEAPFATPSDDALEPPVELAHLA